MNNEQKHSVHHHDGQPTQERAPDAAVPGQADGAIYTCPMHPQVRQIGPGNCPICGMTLEPEVVTAETGPSAELIDMKRRFWIGLVLTMPVLALEMGGHLTNLHRTGS
ncbi:Silver exporting P-type ATPase [Ensifer sp. M14]|uniref:Copper-translocating P-type ATPase, SilP n=1 Tax=Sinorhizobium sp. M14 TaxID=430451 RepID=A0A142BPQ6_9HYPH|nr:Copper-translocating P-type ATPase, SilP [Sinorhizobium sp. M14]RDL48042.1 Silver exporting P-type ATPase [Ensifer sp. M14]